MILPWIATVNPIDLAGHRPELLIASRLDLFWEIFWGTTSTSADTRTIEGSLDMTAIRVRPTRTDLSIANAISAHTNRSTEKAAEFMTWGADEHVLCAAAAAWWLYTRGKSEAERRPADHI